MFKLCKLIIFCRALSGSSLRQTSQQMMLSRCVHSLDSWTSRQWLLWCRPPFNNGIARKAKLPLALERKANAEKVRQWKLTMAKRPASAKRRIARRPAGASAVGRASQAVKKRIVYKHKTGLHILARAMKTRR